ncbi:hypothetical protein [Sporosarcina sp. NPDC096371]|uniref:hypothetical protein n=1 Tax=Sporosarcina sp. NPDC096371 TaxID=3364530 RepID=UPI00382DA8DD
MKHSKSMLFILCIAGAFLLVYGTAVILRLTLGNYLLEGGLANLSYVLLAVLCVLPFLVYLFISGNQVGRILEVIGTSGFFFSILFVYVNFMLVFSSTEKFPEDEIRLLICFPVVALILVVLLQFIHSKNIWWKEIR